MLSTLWSKDAVVERLKEINSKGFISISPEMYRTDDGIVGQILEREFGIDENNLHLADLGDYELKGMRAKKNKSNMLTLFHQAPISGMTLNEIFNKYGYERISKRSGIMKKKLFTTINGNKYNSLGFILKADSENEVHLYNGDTYLSTWDLSVGKEKIRQVILVLAETKGTTNSQFEQFHYVKGYLLSKPKPLDEAIRSGAVKMDLCIDQPLNISNGKIHDRGPHIRIPVSKLNCLFEEVEQIL